MLNKITEIFGEKGSYIALRPDVMRKLIVESRKKFQSYNELGKFLGCSDTYLCQYKRNKSVAVSIDKIIKLLKINNIILTESDFNYIQRSRSGYRMPLEIIFSEKQWSILDDWDHYILGAIATDGCVYKGNIYFKISPKDVEFSAVQIYNLVKLAEKIHQQHVNIYVGIDRGKRLGEPTTSVTLGSISLILFLQKVLVLNFSTDYNIPGWFDSNSEFVYSWLAGVTDGDVDIWRDKNKYGSYWFWRISNGAINSLENIKLLLERYVTSFNTIPRLESQGKYVLRIQHIKFCQKLFPKILPYVIIERKRRRIIEALDYLTEKGLDVKIPEKQRTTRNPIMNKVVEFLRERGLLEKLQNWERLESYGENI